MSADIEREIERILRQELMLGSDRALSLDATLRDLGLDSLAIVHLITALETTYGVEIAEKLLTQKTAITLRGLAGVIGCIPSGTSRILRPAIEQHNTAPLVQHRIERLKQRFAGRGWARNAIWAVLRVSWPWIAALFTPPSEYVLLERVLDSSTIPSVVRPAGIELRPYSAKDRSALTGLWPPYLLENARGQVDRWIAAGARALVAVEGHRIVGLNIISAKGQVGEVTVQPGRRACWGIYLRETPNARRGIGVALLAYSLADALALGFGLQLTGVRVHNTPMLIATTQLLGFRSIGRATRVRLFGVTRWSWEIEGQTGSGFRLVL